ncbi:MAG: paraquat-inducible protein A [Chitinophagaceae bacterium]|nr:paraquat-inducible protein A [Chitinophagaceae bacterium]
MAKKWILLGLHIASLCLLILGLTENMLEIDISKRLIINISLFNEKRSVLGTLQSLLGSSNYLPFILIFLFGLVVPFAKSIIIFYLLLAKNPLHKYYTWISAINKWAMADVFAISIFVAFLGANSMKNTTAALEPGFYFFTAYVIFSGIISVYIGKLIKKPLIFKA